jgi:hypothetical protein
MSKRQPRREPQAAEDGTPWHLRTDLTRAEAMALTPEQGKERRLAQNRVLDRKRYAKDGARSPNPETVRKWKSANPDKARAYSLKYYEDNREKLLARNRAWYAANPTYNCAKASLYRALRSAACPPWVDREALEAIYEGCPEGYHVDHIRPLKGKDACGLHVPWNLQYLPDTENLSKHNKAPPPGYLDWWSEQWCIHAPPTGRVWTPTDYDNI